MVDNRSKKKKDIPLRNCIVCHKIISRNTKAGENRIRPTQYIKALFCSKECKGIWQRENWRSEDSPHWKGGKIKRICPICKKEFFINQFEKERRRCCSKKCLGIWHSQNMKGTKASNWQGGKTPINKLLRGQKKVFECRTKVFERDDFTCQMCGDNRGHNLNAHHIKSWAKYPELRFDINNGITLCRECHIKIHKKTKTWSLAIQ